MGEVAKAAEKKQILWQREIELKHNVVMDSQRSPVWPAFLCIAEGVRKLFFASLFMLSI